MRDKRTGAARKEPVKGAVDKAGKKAMPAPAKKQEAKRPTAKAGTPAPRAAKPAARPTEKPVRRATDNQGKAGKRPTAGPAPAPTRPTPTRPAAPAAKTGTQSTYMNMLDQMRSQSVAAQTGSALGTKPNIGLGTTPNIGLGSNMNYGFK